MDLLLMILARRLGSHSRGALHEHKQRCRHYQAVLSSPRMKACIINLYPADILLSLTVNMVLVVPPPLGFSPLRSMVVAPVRKRSSTRRATPPPHALSDACDYEQYTFGSAAVHAPCLYFIDAEIAIATLRCYSLIGSDCAHVQCAPLSNKHLYTCRHAWMSPATAAAANRRLATAQTFLSRENYYYYAVLAAAFSTLERSGRLCSTFSNPILSAAIFESLKKHGFDGDGPNIA